MGYNRAPIDEWQRNDDQSTFRSLLVHRRTVKQEDGVHRCLAPWPSVQTDKAPGH
jgi:hypothetical protein